MTGGSTAVYAFSAQGLALARRVAPALGARVFAPTRLAAAAPPGGEVAAFADLAALLAETFPIYARHVFVGAAGIAVRAVAPQLRGKAVDPAVAVLDIGARFAVSLVSGHLGGANDLARELAGLTGAQAVITTGTDARRLPAADALAAEKGMAWANLPAAKAVSAALLEGRHVQVYDPEGRLFDGDGAGGLLRPTASASWVPDAPGVWCSWRAGGIFPAAYRVYPRCLCLGLGSRKGTPAEEILAHVRTSFGRAGLAPQSLAAAGTLARKRDDPGMVAALGELGAPATYFSAEELDAAGAPDASPTVRRRVGTGSVCEAAALLLAEGGALVLPKVKSERVTCAAALRPARREEERA